jgi:predicted ATPase
MWLPLFTDLLAAGCDAVGQVDEAGALLDDALELVARTGEGWIAAELTRHKARLNRRRGDIEAATTLYREGLGIARQQGARLWELRAAMSLARLYRDQGRHAEAGYLLAPIRGWFSEGFGTANLAGANALLARMPAVPTTTDERVVGGAMDGSWPTVRR